MQKLNFYDVDKKYIDYLQKEETEARGFTHVPNVSYPNSKKFLCGIVLTVNGFQYYVPVSSYKTKKSDNILITLGAQVVGSLRFNYMTPVPQSCLSIRVIKNEPNLKHKRFLNAELNFCRKNQTKINNQARRTYNNVLKRVSAHIAQNSCDFKLLETACMNYHSV